MKCPPISAKEDLIISGNKEDGTYGDVVHFECVSPNKKLDSDVSDIHCNDKGEWSGPVPKCIGSFNHLFVYISNIYSSSIPSNDVFVPLHSEIRCTAPEIQHGRVESIKVYNKDDALEYTCNTGYRPRQGTPSCTKYGWSMKPECEGDRITYCKESMEIILRKQSVKVATL